MGLTLQQDFYGNSRIKSPRKNNDPEIDPSRSLRRLQSLTQSCHQILQEMRNCHQVQKALDHKNGVFKKSVLPEAFQENIPFVLKASINSMQTVDTALFSTMQTFLADYVIPQHIAFINEHRPILKLNSYEIKKKLYECHLKATKMVR